MLFKCMAIQCKASFNPVWATFLSGTSSSECSHCISRLFLTIKKRKEEIAIKSKIPSVLTFTQYRVNNNLKTILKDSSYNMQLLAEQVCWMTERMTIKIISIDFFHLCSIFLYLFPFPNLCLYETQLIVEWKAECKHMKYSGKEKIILKRLKKKKVCRPLGFSCCYRHIGMMLVKKL